MVEKIFIKDFAGIKNIDITLEEINIIIGPQASGKSICAKLFYFFKLIPQIIINSYDEPLVKRDFEKKVLKKFESYFPSKYLGLKDFQLVYAIGDNSVEVNRIEGKIELIFSEGYLQQLPFLREEAEKYRQKTEEKIEGYDRYKLVLETRGRIAKNVNKVLGNISSNTQQFIPAGRTFFSLFQSNLFSFISNNRTIDPFLVEFGAFYESIKNYQKYLKDTDRLDNEKKKFFYDLSENIRGILHGKYVKEHDSEFLILDDGRKVGLSNVSSGQQELLPLTMILCTYPFVRLRDFGSTFYIEEPEAHIFPDDQRKIIELIAYIYNMCDFPLQFVITTHSPYVLTSINNLIYAGTIGNNANNEVKKKISALINEKEWLKSEKVCAYSLKDGKCDCIKSKKTGLISADYLDSVSDRIGGIFDSLVELS